MPIFDYQCEACGHHFDILHYLGGEIAEASSMASKLSPVGAEVDDQSMTLLKFADGKVGYVGTCWTSPAVFAVRVFGSKGMMHYEIDFGAWDTPHKLHETATLYIQRGKDGYAKREVLKVEESDMFRAELEQFAIDRRELLLEAALVAAAGLLGLQLLVGQALDLLDGGALDQLALGLRGHHDQRLDRNHHGHQDGEAGTAFAQRQRVETCRLGLAALDQRIEQRLPKAHASLR